MNNMFSQPKIVYSISFATFYKNLDSLEAILAENEDVLGLSSFEIESKTIKAEKNDLWRLEIYINSEKKAKNIIQQIKDFSNKNHLKIKDINLNIIKDRDWVTEYQKQLSPIRIGRFFISSQKQSNLCPDKFIPIVLEASRAFGSGEHETTSGCIEAMEHLAIKHDFSAIYDIGTGSGILSFAATKLWKKAKIIACDIEEVSIKVAKFNQKFNNSKIKFYQNSVEKLGVDARNNKFDLIISNILAEPLIGMAQDIASLLQINGRLIISGFLSSQADKVIKAYSLAGMQIDKNFEKENWVILILKK